MTELADLAACPRRYHLRHEVGLDEHPAPPRRPRLADDLAIAAPGLDARERGTLVHGVLERAELAGGVAALDVAARALGLDPTTDATRALLAPARAFLATPFGTRLARLPAEAVRRELSFAFRAGGSAPRPAKPGEPPPNAPGTTLLVKGQMDLVIVEPEGITVVDYKLARATDEPRYAFQLAVYAAAARALWGRPVRVGLAFLLDADPSPRLTALPAAALDEAEVRLGRLATTLADARRRATFPGLELAGCDAIGCGFVARCHGRS